MEGELRTIEPASVQLRNGTVVPFSKERQRVTPRVNVNPRIALAIRAYTAGQLSNQEAAAAMAKCSTVRFNAVLNSPAGEAIVNEVRKQLETRYQNLFKKFIDVIEEGLDHPEPGVALAAANLYQKSQIGTKVKVELSAEDVIKQIMDGSYQGK